MILDFAPPLSSSWLFSAEDQVQVLAHTRHKLFRQAALQPQYFLR